MRRYLARKHGKPPAKGARHPDQIPIADVLSLYATNVAPGHTRPKETIGRIKRLRAFFGGQMLGEINGSLCRAYVEHRGTAAAARRELEDLRAAINHHRKEGHCAEIVGIALPDAPVGRDRWLTRSEAARLIWAAWRHRETQGNRATRRLTRKHVARFILVALYTGTRAGAVCGAALEPTEGRGWIDTERGVFYRRAQGAKETKKRQPPIPLPERLLSHVRRWKRLKARNAVEWNGDEVGRINKAFARVAKDAGLPGVSPHVLRHTAATWMMQAGVPPWEAAGYLGMTQDILWDRYGHQHPDHLRGARDGFRRHREAVAKPVARSA